LNNVEEEKDIMRKSIFVALGTPLLGLALLACGTIAASAEPEWSNPVIKGYGKIVSLPNAAMQPDKNADYKVVFNLTVGVDPDKVNSSLDRVARTVNIFASAGVPVSHLHFVVVIHGPATPIVLDNAHYQEKFKLDNPNIALIDALEKAGVKVVVCGQALAGNKIEHEWVNPKVEITLSAITDVVILEKAGYVLFPL
jgi:intracellular sulfur oxidation DsrE/DsrF family protein